MFRNVTPIENSNQCCEVRSMEYSVLMTVYQGDNPAYFELSLQSMVDQTIKPEEIILVKDGPVPDSIQKKL